MIPLEFSAPAACPPRAPRTVLAAEHDRGRATTRVGLVCARNRLRPLRSLVCALCAASLGLACEGRTRTVSKYDDGTPCAEIEFKAGVRDGAYVLHHVTGHVELEAHYVAGLREGSYAAWHPNGLRAVTGQYQRGLRVGTWQEWGENGAPISAGEYRAGDKTGLWRVYDAQGQLAAEDLWENATRLSRRLVVAEPPPVAPDGAPGK